MKHYEAETSGFAELDEASRQVVMDPRKRSLSKKALRKIAIIQTSKKKELVFPQRDDDAYLTILR